MVKGKQALGTTESGSSSTPWHKSFSAVMCFTSRFPGVFSVYFLPNDYEC